MYCSVLAFQNMLIIYACLLWHAKYSIVNKRIRIIEANKMHCFSTLFLISSYICFGQTYCPSSGILIL